MCRSCLGRSQREDGVVLSLSSGIADHVPIPSLPPQADRSLAGVVRYLVERLVMGEPARWTIPGTQSQQQLEESDAGASDFDDDLYGMGSVLVSQKETSTKALRE
jgi:hypothetical protein